MALDQLIASLPEDQLHLLRWLTKEANGITRSSEITRSIPRIRAGCLPDYTDEQIKDTLIRLFQCGALKALRWSIGGTICTVRIERFLETVKYFIHESR